MDFTDKKVVIAGSFLTIDKQADGKAMLEKLGAKVTGSVSSKTDYLLLGIDGGAKAKKAEELGTTIISELDLLDAAKTIKRDQVEAGAQSPLDHGLRSVFDRDQQHDTNLFSVAGKEVSYESISPKASGPSLTLGFTGPTALERLLSKKGLDRVETICVGSGYGNSKCNNYAKLLLQHAAKLSNLKYLAFETMRGEVNLSDILEAFPSLEGLYILESDIDCPSPIRHAELKELHVLNAGKSVAELLSSSSLPKLTHFQVGQLTPELLTEVEKLSGLHHFGYQQVTNSKQNITSLKETKLPVTIQSLSVANLGVEELEELGTLTWWKNLKHLHLNNCTVNAKVKYLTANALPELEFISFNANSTKRLIAALGKIKFAPHVGFGFPSCGLGASEAILLRTLALTQASRFVEASHNHLTSDKQLNLFAAMPCPVEIRNQQAIPMDYEDWE